MSFLNTYQNVPSEYTLSRFTWPTATVMHGWLILVTGTPSCSFNFFSLLMCVEFSCNVLVNIITFKCKRRVRNFNLPRLIFRNMQCSPGIVHWRCFWDYFSAVRIHHYRTTGCHALMVAYGVQLSWFPCSIIKSAFSTVWIVRGFLHKPLSVAYSLEDLWHFFGRQLFWARCYLNSFGSKI